MVHNLQRFWSTLKAL